MNKLVSLTALVLLAGAALAQPEAFLQAGGLEADRAELGAFSKPGHWDSGAR